MPEASTPEGRERQRTAKVRNWKIKILRGAYALMRNMQHRNSEVTCALIDEMIVDMGAESEKVRREKYTEEMRQEMERLIHEERLTQK